MFLTLFDVLQEYIATFSNTDEKTFSSHQVSTIKDSLIDVNNNNISVMSTRIKQNCSCSDAATNFGNDDRVRIIDKDYALTNIFIETKRRMILYLQ